MPVKKSAAKQIPPGQLVPEFKKFRLDESRAFSKLERTITQVVNPSPMTTSICSVVIDVAEGTFAIKESVGGGSAAETEPTPATKTMAAAARIDLMCMIHSPC